MSEALSHARKRKVLWLDVARSVRQLEADGVPEGNVEPPIRIAERLSGYSANQLRRMLAALGFLDELAAVDAGLYKSLGSPKFSHCEMLAKIWRTDRNAVLDLLRKEPVLRYQSLYRLHEDIQKRSGATAMAAGKRAVSAFRESFLTMVGKAPQTVSIFGNASYKILEPRVHHKYAKPALLLQAEQTDRHDGFGQRKNVSWAGFDFIFTTNRDDPALMRQMMAMATEASFLDAQIVILPDGPAIDVVQTFVVELNLTNVGVIVMTDQYARWERSPFGPPVPDRRELWHAPRVSSTLSSWTLDDVHHR